MTGLRAKVTCGQKLTRSAEVLWSGNDASAGQVEQACQAARRAFPAWAKRPFSERRALVEKFAALLEANKAELTRIIACETSKPRWEATTEVTAMINKIAISVKAYHTRTGEQHTEMPDGAYHAAPPSARGTGGVWPV